MRAFWGIERTALPLAAALVLLAAAALVALTNGPYPLPASRLPGLIGQAWRGTAAGPEATVLLNIRLPRVVAAALVGAALAAAGAAYQMAFRNPLVSPDILGVSAGAGLGAVAGIFFGLPVWAIQALGFATGMGTVAVVMTVAALAMGGARDTLALVLTGIAVGALAGAGIAIFKVLADPDNQLPAMTFWLLGSLAGVKLADAGFLVPAVLLGLGPLVLLRWRIGTLAMGEDEARALGIETARLRLIVIACATLMTAAAVAAAGTIGWVGLMVPHMARLVTGPRFDRMLPVAVALGAALMLLIDTAARSIAATELPLGVLTALIGAPVFLTLLSRGRRSWA
ncbi:MAG: iron ABC transporter permease [Paracoccus sp. (in: a-proteobacteria)]|nr:iron ABC transporter permease [Paracoccus sp. (in: a-proteobacteria)]